MDAIDPSGMKRDDMRLGLATANVVAAITRKRQKVRPMMLDTEPKMLRMQSQEDMSANIERLRKWNAKRKAMNEHNQQT